MHKLLLENICISNNMYICVLVTDNEVCNLLPVINLNNE